MFTLRKPSGLFMPQARLSISDGENRVGKASHGAGVRFVAIAGFLLLALAINIAPAEARPDLGSAVPANMRAAGTDLVQPARAKRRVKEDQVTAKNDEPKPDQDEQDKQKQDDTQQKQDDTQKKQDDTQKESKTDCGRGMYSSDGHCCARGTSWNGKRCLRRSTLQPRCPGGNCDMTQERTCPTGTIGRFPNCRTANACPAGMVGAPPNCRRFRGRGRGREFAGPCPPGTAGVPPVCRRISRRPCPAGTIQSTGRCIILQGQRPVPTPNLNLGARRPATPTPQVGIGANARPIWR
jgi:hypothetical protein